MKTMQELELRRDELKARLALETEIALMEQRLVLGLTDLHKLAGVGVQVVSREFGLLPSQITLRTKEARITWPRQVLLYLLREISGSPLQDIARLFRMNHGNIIYACRKVRDRMDTEPGMRARVLALARKLKPTANELFLSYENSNR